MAATTNTAKESIVSLKFFIFIKFNVLRKSVKKQKCKKMALAADRSIQTEQKKLNLLENRFCGVTNKIWKAVAAKRRVSRLEARNTWKVCFYAAKESCSVAVKIFCGRQAGIVM
jgi:hypothetical protein